MIIFTIVNLVLGSVVPNYGNAFNVGDSGSILNPNTLNELLPNNQENPLSIPNPVKAMEARIPSVPTENIGTQVPPTIQKEESNPVMDNEITNPIEMATGLLKLEDTDLQIPGIGMDFRLERSYSSDNQEVGAFGLGWKDNLGSKLQMYSDFNMGEFRYDGSTTSFSFVKDDPEAYVVEFDGDEMINYDLDQGHYEPNTKGEQLERKGQHEYVMTNELNASITYYGYYAPWRENQDPKVGKMVKQQDRYGNTIHYRYDEEGNLKEITDTAGRNISFIWNNGVIKEITDPSGKKIKYEYDEQKRLKKITTPDQQTTEYDYDANHHIKSIKNALGGKNNLYI